MQKIVFKSFSVDLVSRGYLLKTIKAGYKFERFYNVDKGYYRLFSLWNDTSPTVLQQFSIQFSIETEGFQYHSQQFSTVLPYFKFKKSLFELF